MIQTACFLLTGQDRALQFCVLHAGGNVFIVHTGKGKGKSYEPFPEGWDVDEELQDLESQRAILASLQEEADDS